MLDTLSTRKCPHGLAFDDYCEGCEVEELGLKNCPFCGGDAEWNKGRHKDGSDWHYIACTACEAMGPSKSCQREGLILDWNTRA